MQCQKTHQDSDVHLKSPSCLNCWLLHQPGVSKNDGTQQLLVFLQKMTILGCFGGTTILGNTQPELFACNNQDSFLCVFHPHPTTGKNSQVVLGSLSQLVKRGKDGTAVVEKTTRKTAVADTWVPRGEKHMEVFRSRLRAMEMEMKRWKVG